MSVGVARAAGAASGSRRGACGQNRTVASYRPRISGHHVGLPQLSGAPGMTRPEMSNSEQERMLLLGQMLDRLMAVNGFFITAGYASFFGLWAMVRDEIPSAYVVSSSLWLLLSAALFVGWHIIG